MRQRDRTAGRRLAAAPLLAAVLPLLAAVAAAAHGTRAEVAIQQTGDRDLLVRLRWAEDGHAIVEPARVDVSATNSATGQTVGPLAATASSQPGEYAVTLPVGDGRWVVDATATGPATGQGTRTLDVPLPPGAAVPGAAVPETDRRPLLFGVLAGGLTLLAGIAVVTGLNRRARVGLAARRRGRARPTPARGGRSAPARNRRGARAGAGAHPKRRRG